MAATVQAIAKKAFDAVSRSITDAIQDAVLDDGATQVAGRVVFGGEKAPGGFPIATSKDKVREAYLEGFPRVASIGETITAGGVVYHVLSVRDIVEAGGLVVANVIAAVDMAWQTVQFQRETLVADGAGGQVGTWGAIAGAPTVAGIVAMSGVERWASMRIEAQSRWVMFVEYFPGLLNSDRASVDGIDYNINFINDVEKRGAWYVLELQQGVAT